MWNHSLRTSCEEAHPWNYLITVVAYAKAFGRQSSTCIDLTEHSTITTLALLSHAQPIAICNKACPQETSVLGKGGGYAHTSVSLSGRGRGGEGCDTGSTGASCPPSSSSSASICAGRCTAGSPCSLMVLVSDNGASFHDHHVSAYSCHVLYIIL